MDEGPWLANLHFLRRADVGYCQARRGSGGAAASILWPTHQTKSHHLTQVRNEDPHDQVLNEARELHWRVLEAAHLLEQDIERLSQAASRAKHAKCQHPYGCSHSRGRPQGRHAWSLSPHRQKKLCNFSRWRGGDVLWGRSSRELWGQVMGGREVEESNLGLQPTLQPDLEQFLETPTTTKGARDRWGLLPEPSINNYKMWLEWWAHQLDTPNWWKELVAIPNLGDLERLAWKICTSFEVPQVRCEILRDHGEYTVPPAPKCIQWDMFLLDVNSHLPDHDYWLKPLQRTLVYAQALQYWAEKANPLVPGEPHHLAMCIHELRQCMKRYTTFSDCDAFEGLKHGLPGVEVEETIQPKPTEPLPVDDPAVLTIASSGLENISAALITTPATSEEELVTLVTTSAVLADELADPPTPSETTGNARSWTEPEYLKWVKVHLSHVAASMGSVTCNPRDTRWHCHNSSSSW